MIAGIMPATKSIGSRLLCPRSRHPSNRSEFGVAASGPARIGMASKTSTFFSLYEYQLQSLAIHA